MVDAALIELEGVIFDTHALRRYSLRDALIEQGLAPFIDLDAPDGGRPTDAVPAALRKQGIEPDPVLVDVLTARAERAFSARLAASGASLTLGASELIYGAAASARLAVVTSARRAEVELMLRLSALADCFSVIVTADDVLETKPSDEGYRMALARLNAQLGAQRAVSPRNMLALEHATAGIRAARQAGVRCVAVGPLPAHLAIEADAYVPTLASHTLLTLRRLAYAGEGMVP